MSDITTKEVEKLKKELFGLFEHIQRIRKEIASIHVPNDPFEDMSDQLDAIVGATESATNDIMENVEQIEALAGGIRQIGGEPVTAKCDEIEERVSNVIVACSFQDITGQRVTKVVTSIKHIEERINSLVKMWGENEIAKQIVPPGEETDEYKKYLNGPQLAGDALSQNDVDAILTGGSQKADEIDQEKKKKKKVKKKKAKAEEKPSAPEPAPAEEEKAEDGPALDQNAIDALFD